jgi:hypothetical protein
MAVKEFNNYDYTAVRKNKQEISKTLKYASIGFVVLILGAMLWGIIAGTGFFNKRTETVNRPIEDVISQTAEELKEDRDKTQMYADARIPYRDPEGKFEIKFVTPYVSDQIVVIIKTADRTKQEKARSESAAIITEAKSTVVISSVSYINNY